MITTIFGLIGLISDGQTGNSNYHLELTTNPINVNLNTSASLETPQTFHNAIIMKIASKESKNYIVQVSGRVNPTPTPILISKMGIKLTSAPPSGYNGPKLIKLDNAAQMIGGGRHEGNYYYYYDLILEPIGYEIKPDSYQFTITFTMTPL